MSFPRFIRSIAAVLIVSCWGFAGVTDSIADDEGRQFGKSQPQQKLVQIDEKAMKDARGDEEGALPKEINPQRVLVIAVLTVFAAIAGWGFSRKSA